MPQWLHDRAHHLMDKNPSMPKSMAWALATQQGYATGKNPKSYGTKEGHEDAREKYREPRSHYEQVADPKEKSASIHVAMVAGMQDELQKIAAFLHQTMLKGMAKMPTVSKMGQPVTSGVQGLLGNAKTAPPPQTKI